MESMWFGTIACSSVNQKPERPVSTRPLSGISVGRTTSKVEMRSLATSSRSSSSSSKISRTLPLARCTAGSGTQDFLLPVGERGESLEQDVHVGERGLEIEAVVEPGRVEPPGD